MLKIDKKMFLIGLCVALTMLVILPASVNAAPSDPPHLVLNRHVAPESIYLYGTDTPDTATVTLTVTGAGDPVVERVPLNIIFAIDSSGSMRNTDPNGIRRTASIRFVNSMSTSVDKAGVVSWDENIDFSIPLTNNFANVRTGISNVDDYGGTNLDGGLSRSIQLLDSGSSSATKAIIFLTDGDGTYTYSSNPSSPAARAKAKGYKVYAVGLNPPSSARYKLRDMATATGGKYFIANSANDLIPIFDEIKEEVSKLVGKNLQVRDVLPEGLEFVPNSFSRTPLSVNGRTVVWSIPAINIDEKWSVNYKVSAIAKGEHVLSEATNAGVTFIRYDSVKTFVAFPEKTLTVLNHAPVAKLTGPYVGDECSSIVLDASKSTDKDGDTLTYRWDFDNDGVWDTLWLNTATIAKTWNDDWQGTIKVEVNDGDATSVATTTVTVRNVAPLVTVGPDQVTDEGSEILVIGEFSDPGIEDTHAIRWDFGDGTIVDGTLNATHVYADNGEYTVSLTVIDDDGGIGQATLEVSVNNVAPTVNIENIQQDQAFVLSDNTIVILDPVNITGSASDPGSDDLNVTWVWGDNTSNLESFYPNENQTFPVFIQEIVSHTYLEPGNYTILLIVADDDGGVTNATLEITVLGPRDLKESAIEDLESIDFTVCTHKNHHSYCCSKNNHDDDGMDTDCCKHYKKKVCKPKHCHQCLYDEYYNNKIIYYIEKSLSDCLWEDSTHLNSKWGSKVFCYEFHAAKKLECRIHSMNYQIKYLNNSIKCGLKKGYNVTDLELKIVELQSRIEIYQSALIKLVKADSLLSSVAISDAAAMSVKNEKYEKTYECFLAKAARAKVRADLYVEKGRYSCAILSEKSAWVYAQKAMSFADKEGCSYYKHCCFKKTKAHC